MSIVIGTTLGLEGLCRCLEPSLNLMDFAVPLILSRGREYFLLSDDSSYRSLNGFFGLEKSMYLDPRARLLSLYGMATRLSQ